MAYSIVEFPFMASKTTHEGNVQINKDCLRRNPFFYKFAFFRIINFTVAFTEEAAAENGTIFCDPLPADIQSHARGKFNRIDPARL